MLPASSPHLSERQEKAIKDVIRDQSFDGACLCGSLQLRITGPTKWCAHCHCTMCQRAHGAPFVTWIGVEAAALELINSESLRWFASSEEAERGSCSRCASSVFFRSSRWPGEVHIARACIPGEIDREPSAHACAKTAVGWVHLSDELSRKF